jgi:hypothetical protein
MAMLAKVAQVARVDPHMASPSDAVVGQAGCDPVHALVEFLERQAAVFRDKADFVRMPSDRVGRNLDNAFRPVPEDFAFEVRPCFFDDFPAGFGV